MRTHTPTVLWVIIFRLNIFLVTLVVVSFVATLTLCLWLFKFYLLFHECAKQKTFILFTYEKGGDVEMLPCLYTQETCDWYKYMVVTFQGDTLLLLHTYNGFKTNEYLKVKYLKNQIVNMPHVSCLCFTNELRTWRLSKLLRFS